MNAGSKGNIINICNGAAVGQCSVDGKFPAHYKH